MENLPESLNLPEERPPTRRRGRMLIKVGLICLGIVILLILAGVAGFFYQRRQAEQFWRQAGSQAEQGQCGPAIENYTAALAVWPVAAREHDMEALTGRASCYLQSGQPAKAIDDL